MKITTLMLSLLVALSFVGCRGTTRAERMPVVADTIGDMLEDAQEELRVLRRRHTGLRAEPQALAQLHDLAMDIQTEVLGARSMLAEARQSVDVDKLRTAGDLTLAVFLHIQDLQEAGILVESATASAH